MNLKKIVSSVIAGVMTLSVMGIMVSAATAGKAVTYINADSEGHEVLETFSFDQSTTAGTHYNLNNRDAALQGVKEGDKLVITYDFENDTTVGANGIKWRAGFAFAGTTIYFTATNNLPENRNVQDSGVGDSSVFLTYRAAKGGATVTVTFTLDAAGQVTAMDTNLKCSGDEVDMKTIAFDHKNPNFMLITGTRGGDDSAITLKNFDAKLVTAYEAATADMRATADYYWDEAAQDVAEGSSEAALIRGKGFSFGIYSNDDTIFGIKLTNDNAEAVDGKDTLNTVINPNSAVVIVGAIAITTEGHDTGSLADRWILAVDKSGEGEYEAVEIAKEVD